MLQQKQHVLQKICLAKLTVPAQKALLRGTLPATLPSAFELAQKEVATGGGRGNSQKLLHLPALAVRVEGAPKPSFGFDVRKLGSPLNAFQNHCVLMARSGTSACSLWQLSMMCPAGQESV